MKHKFLSFIILISAAACSSSQNASQTAGSSQLVSTSTDQLLSYQTAITHSYVQDHLSAFSADSMMGRETGTEGGEKAAHFLAKQYKKLGLQPVGDNNSYYQHYDLTASRTDSVAYSTYAIDKDITTNELNKSVNSAHSSANFIRRYGGNTTIEGEIVFAGYGLQNQELGINHLQGTNLKGKWLLIFEDVPQVVDGDTLYQSQGQFSQTWLRNMLQQGVAGILMIPNTSDEEFQEAVASNQESFGEPSGMQLAYRNQQGGGPGWSLTTIAPAKAAEIMERATGLSDLGSARENLDQNITTFTAQPTGIGLMQQPYITDVTIETANIVAYLEGADPQLKDEVVVLSAHYDHVGIGQPDSTGDTIYNGANDDGSGTIGVLSAARAFSRAAANGVKPRRSILFLSVSGEEKGLLGSRYYSDHPIFSMENTVANINTDMIGRVDPEHRERGVTDYIYIIGGDIISSQLSSLLKKGNSQAGNLQLDMRYNDLTDPNQFYRRSDHWNFGRFGVPFVFFFNGVHKDYHRPSDEVEKINFDLLAKTARSMYATTVMVANADSAPQVDNQEFIEITQEN